MVLSRLPPAVFWGEKNEHHSVFFQILCTTDHQTPTHAPVCEHVPSHSHIASAPLATEIQDSDHACRQEGLSISLDIHGGWVPGLLQPGEPRDKLQQRRLMLGRNYQSYRERYQMGLDTQDLGQVSLRMDLTPAISTPQGTQRVSLGTGTQTV